jgi:peptidylprolyl isomerase
MALDKKDFIEIEFLAKTKDGELFDSNLQEEISKINPQARAKPFIFCLGEGMFLKSIEDFLIGKEVGKYKIDLKPEQAFGKRNPLLIQKIPRRIFLDHKVNPLPGISFNFDGKIAKVLAVSGGRVIVDFNNPIAGKDVVYEISVLRKILDINEKVKALNEFLFRKNFDFKIEGQKLFMFVDKQYLQFVVLFKEKFSSLLELDLEVKEISDSKENSSEPSKTEQ